MSNEINNLYKFGEFSYDRKADRLWKNGELIPLPSKARDLLSLLLERSGEFVSKEEIFEKVWSDTFVEDGVLTQNIYILRKALGNTADGLPIIENKTRLGYRVTVPIALIENSGEIAVEETVEPAAENALEIPKPSRGLKSKLVLASVTILILIVGVSGYRFLRPKISSFLRKPVDAVKFTQMTNSSDVQSATLSPDGNFIAFVRENKVFLKDVASNKELPIDIPNVPSFRSLQFSVDGNFLYFCNNSAYLAASKILKVSRFGGDTELIVERNQGLFSLSPDNKFIAFFVSSPGQGPELFVRNLETRDERVILRLDPSQTSVVGNSSLSWSPDGRRILCSTQSFISAASQLLIIDVEKATSEEIKIPRLRRFQEAHWLPDGENFIVSATENGRVYHLWKVYYPDGDIQPLTTGLNSFERPIISSDGKKILATQTTNVSNLFTASDTDLTVQRQLTSGNTNRLGQTSLAWTSEREMLFSSQAENDTVENFWLIDAEGQGRRQITAEKNASPSTAISNGKHIYYSVVRKRFSNIERIDAGGGNLAEVTTGGDGQRRSPQLSPDGNWLYYIFREGTTVKILRLNLANQNEEVLIEDETVRCGLFLEISPDGKYLACPNWRPRTAADADNHNARLTVVSTETRSVVADVPIERISANFRFSPDSNSIEFIAAFEGGTRLMRQGFANSEPTPILSMPKDRIFNFAWSKNGRNLAIAKGQQYRDAVLLTEFDK